MIFDVDKAGYNDETGDWYKTEELCSFEADDVAQACMIFEHIANAYSEDLILSDGANEFAVYTDGRVEFPL